MDEEEFKRNLQVHQINQRLALEREREALRANELLQKAELEKHLRICREKILTALKAQQKYVVLPIQLPYEFTREMENCQIWLDQSRIDYDNYEEAGGGQGIRVANDAKIVSVTYYLTTERPRSPCY